MTKQPIALGQRLVSTMLAFVLAFGVCVPAVSIAALATPDAAWAEATERSYADLTPEELETARTTLLSSASSAKSAVATFVPGGAGGGVFGYNQFYTAQALWEAGAITKAERQMLQNHETSNREIFSFVENNFIEVPFAERQPGDILVCHASTNPGCHITTSLPNPDGADYETQWMVQNQSGYVYVNGGVHYPHEGECNYYTPIRKTGVPEEVATKKYEVTSPEENATGTGAKVKGTLSLDEENDKVLLKGVPTPNTSRPKIKLIATITEGEETHTHTRTIKTSGTTQTALKQLTTGIEISCAAPGDTVNVSLKEVITPASGLPYDYNVASIDIAVRDINDPDTEPATLTVLPNGTVPAGTEYVALKVFSGEVSETDGVKAAGNIQYAPGITDVIISGSDTTFESAQAAAEFIKVSIEQNGFVSGDPLTADNFGMALAKRIAQTEGATAIPVISGGDAVTLDGEGYWLVVRKDALTGENSVASSPMFALCGKGNTAVVEKSTVPALIKQVQEDSTGEFGTAANHTLNQEVNYRLTGTVAENVDAYSTYKYNFHDEWNADKLTLKADSVKVKIVSGETETLITSVAGVSINDKEAGKLDITMDNLKAIYPGISATDSIVVEYAAYQSGTSASPEGIENAAFLEYSNNPIVADSLGTTPKSTTLDFSYRIQLHKTDNNTGDDLAGVEFTVKNKNGTYLAIVDGKLCESGTAYSFKTDENGMIVLDGIDADDYTFVETKELPGYENLGADITVSINDADKADAKGVVTSVSTLVSGEDADGAVALIQVSNVKLIELPSTGELGVYWLITIAVSLLVCAAVVSRRNKGLVKPMIV